MPIYFDIHRRLEPRPSPQKDLQRGFAAELADPVWLLGRQWQMGEHQGENAASPVSAKATLRFQPIEPMADREDQFPGKHGEDPITPAEAIVEGEPDDWWTLGRRIRVGLAAKAAVDAIPEAQLSDAARDALRLPPLPEPYGAFRGGYDGRKLDDVAQEIGLDAALFADVPRSLRGHHWEAGELVYEAEFPCANTRLRVPRHDGGEVEWWSMEASEPLVPTVGTQERKFEPAPFHYPGAPRSRWWQIEDAQSDIGGFPPDRSHLATMLLLDLVLSHSDDWFTFPIAAHIGELITIEKLSVTDSFGKEWLSSDFTNAPDAAERVKLNAPTDWSLFKVTGLDSNALALFSVVATPLVCDAIEEVMLGIDEDANLLWGVERRAEWRSLTAEALERPSDPKLEPNPDLGVSSDTMYLYRPSTSVPRHWHPYVIDGESAARRFVQARLGDYGRFQALTAQQRRGEAWLTPAPLGQLLLNDRAQPGEPVHHLEPATIPVQGLRLDRRYVLGRRTDGRPVLWIQRQRLPMLGPPVSGLRFDVLEPKS